MTKGQKKRVYTPEFKAEAVRRLEAGVLASTVAKDLKVGTSLLYTWKNKSKPGKVNTGGDRMRDAIIYLRHARDTMGSGKRLNRSQLLTLLALSTLEGR